MGQVWNLSALPGAHRYVECGMRSWECGMSDHSAFAIPNSAFQLLRQFHVPVALADET